MLTRAPYGRIHVAEGLRAARGIAAGFDAHDVTVLFTDDAVYAVRSGADREALLMAEHVADLIDLGGRLLADGAAMAARNVDPDDLAQDVRLVDGHTAARLIRDADHHLDF